MELEGLHTVRVAFSFARRYRFSTDDSLPHFANLNYFAFLLEFDILLLYMKLTLILFMYLFYLSCSLVCFLLCV